MSQRHQGNRNNHNNVSFCDSLKWVCDFDNDQTSTDLSSECSQRKTTGCCNYDPKSYPHNDSVSGTIKSVPSYYLDKLRCQSMLQSLLSGRIPEWTKPSTL